MKTKHTLVHPEISKFHVKSFTIKRYFQRYVEDISRDILDGETENRYFENPQK